MRSKAVRGMTNDGGEIDEGFHLPRAVKNFPGLIVRDTVPAWKQEDAREWWVE